MKEWDLWHLGSTGTQGPSLAKPSGLRIPCCHSCSISCNCGLDPIPGPGTPYAEGWPKKKKNNKKFFKGRDQAISCGLRWVWAQG